MNAFDCFLINMVCILLPLLIYQVYKMHCHNLEKNEEELILYVMLTSSLYLLLKYGHFTETGIYQFAFVNLPILIAYYFRQKGFALLMSIFVAIYEAWNYPNFLFAGILTTIIYFVLYIWLEKKFQGQKLIQLFLIITTFVFTVSIASTYQEKPIVQLPQILLAMILLYGSTEGIIWIIQKGDDVLDLNAILKELEKEKVLRASLFQITHEIKNPIAVCKGYLDMMDLATVQKKMEYIPIIKNEINRTLVLMDDFLDYTKIKITPEIMDITLLLEELLRELKPLLKEKNVETIIVLSKDEIDILGDYNRLKQVFVNVLKNAMEARAPHRKMKLEITMKKSKNKVTITVKDNGVGMSKETLNRCGEMFYTTKTNGTGIGVSLANTIIERHNGTIQYQSEEGHGTTVTIQLPTA